MTSEAKRALSRTIRELRKRLIDDLGEATERAYRLSIDAKKAALDEASRVRRTRLEGWIDEQARASGKSDSVSRLRADVIKDAAATLLEWIVYLRLLEAAGLRTDKVVTGGWESKGYKDFREAAPELVRPGPSNETEGYATLLQLVFDELALDLPGLYGPVRMTSLVPVSASTLRAVITALDDDELASVWTDDTTLGWIYQYWNDPEREALDAKVAAKKKLENHEIASKTQMFTERYMVEWLLHNSLGQMWLTMCRKHGWTADVERDGVLVRLEQRRIAWRAKREAGEVTLDALMPIESGLEDRWKYWIPQPMPDDAVTSAPDSVRTLKLLDPACGSGHFLVIACELLFFLYQEEARHRRESWSGREIVESILENNLHGIDIDPRAVQIAAAALMLKARQLCANTEPRTLNLVAPSLSLASLAENDPARLTLYTAVEQETGIPSRLIDRLLAALAGATHLGTLLRVDAEIDASVREWDAQSRSVAGQGMLFGGFSTPPKRITTERARVTLLGCLEAFLDHHTSGADLGLRLRGEQLAAGVRFVRLVREEQYHLVVGNPPYLGTDNIDDNEYIDLKYEHYNTDLYAAFVWRSISLARLGGFSALLTLKNWMFTKEYIELRSWLLDKCDIRIIGDFDKGAFDAMETSQRISVSLNVIRRSTSIGGTAIALRPTAPGEKYWGRDRTDLKRAAVLCQRELFEWEPASLSDIPQRPLLYSWNLAQIRAYVEAEKLGDAHTVRYGLSTQNNTRWLRRPWEVRRNNLMLRSFDDTSEWDGRDWVTYIKGSEGRRWCDEVSDVLLWRHKGLELATYPDNRYGRGATWYYRRGVAFASIGVNFSARAHSRPSIFGHVAGSVFCDDVAQMVCFLNSRHAREMMESLNPGIHFLTTDVERLALLPIDDAKAIFQIIEESFLVHESHREPSVEFRQPGPSPWSSAQLWAQAAVDKAPGQPLAPFVS